MLARLQSQVSAKCARNPLITWGPVAAAEDSGAMLHQPTLLLDRIHLHKSHRRSVHASQIASVSAAFTPSPTSVEPLRPSLVSNFIQTPAGQRAHPSRISHDLEGDSTPKHVGSEWRMRCAIHDATAIARQSVC